MKKNIAIFSLLLVASTLSFAQHRTDSTTKRGNLEMSEKEAKDLIRQKFIISSYDTYYPNQYGAYLIPKNEMFKGVCSNKRNKQNLYLVDHEGGQVRRIPSTTLSAKDSMNISMQAYSKMWRDDLNWIQMNCLDVTLGPTVDVALNSRSYSKDLSFNFKIVDQLIKESYSKFKVKYTIKHFPGTYEKCDQPDPKREQQICNLDMKEINSGWGNYLRNTPPPSLMVSHNYYKTKQDEKTPAFMDEDILKYLRDDVKYNGVLITDALWELEKPVDTKDLIIMFKYNDLIMMLSHEKIEQSINVLYKVSKDFPIILEYAKDSKNRIKKWRETKNN